MIHKDAILLSPFFLKMNSEIGKKMLKIKCPSK